MKILGLVASVLLCMVIFNIHSASAGVTESTVIQRLNTLRGLDGKFFTVNGEACVTPREKGHSCSNCNSYSVVTRTDSVFRQTSRLTKWPTGSAYATSHARNYKEAPVKGWLKGYSCCGFANFAGWYLFADTSSSTVSYYRYLDCTYNDLSEYAKPGDILRTNGHSMVYVGYQNGKIQVLDCNFSGPQCTIKNRSFSPSGTSVTISRAYNYDLPENEKYRQIASVTGSNGHEYYLVMARCSWADANAYVQSHYGDSCHLVTIENAEEAGIVNGLVQSWNGCGHGGMVWTGAHYTENGWEWVTGEPFEYSNWATNGSTKTPYGTIMGVTGKKSSSVSYTSGKWYAQAALEQWSMSGFVVEYTPAASEMEYFRFENELLPTYIRQGTSFTYYGWCETNVPIARVDVQLTKNDALVGAVCWYPISSSDTKIYFSDIVRGLSFMDTANWTQGTYYYDFNYYDVNDNYVYGYHSPAIVGTSVCSHSTQVHSVLLKEPTCAEPGEYWTYCNQCMIPMEKVGEIDPLEHTPGEWETVQEPTETAAGLRELHCTVCGAVINQETLPKLTPVSLIEYQVVYEGSGVRLRKSPGLSGTQIGLLSRGTHFFVHDGTQVEADGYTWAYAHTQSGQEGYIAISNPSLVQPVSSGTTTAVTFHSQAIDEVSGHIYKLFSGNISWESAKSYAASLGDGWQLACMDGDSDSEQSIIENLVVNFNKACWLGGHNLTGNWMWLSGVSIDVNDPRWDDGEPSGNYKTSTENYLGIYANDNQTSYSTARKWNDFQLTSATPKGFVVEYTPDAESTDMEWELDGQGVLTITGSGMITYDGWDTDRVVDVFIEYGVTDIGAETFQDCSHLVSVTIPSTVRTIGDSAFARCELKTLLIPNGVTSIGEFAFQSNPIVNVMLPVSLTNIMNGAFWNCGNLSNVYYAGTEAQWAEVAVDINNTELLGANIHYSSFPSNMAGIILGPNTYTSDSNDYMVVGLSEVDSTVTMFHQPSVTGIGGTGLADDTVIEYLNIEEGYTDIYESAFEYAFLRLKQVYLPSTLQYIAANAFVFDSAVFVDFYFENDDVVLADQAIDMDVYKLGDHPVFGEDYRITFHCNVGSTAEAYALAHGWEVVYEDEITLSFDRDEYTLFWDGVFWSPVFIVPRVNPEVLQLTLPIEYTSSTDAVGINEYGCAVGNHSGSAVVTARYGEAVATVQVKVLGPSDFLTLPSSVTVIEQDAFNGDRSIEVVVLPDGIKRIESAAFAGCSNLEAVWLPASLEYIAPDAFAGCPKLELYMRDDNMYALNYARQNGYAYNPLEDI